MKTTENSAQYLLLFLAMLFVSCKLACNALFFRQVTFNFLFLDDPIKVTCSGLVYPAIYILSDAIVLVSNRKTAICIVLFGIICDGLSSFLFSSIANSPIPISMSTHELLTSHAFNLVGAEMWQLFYTGIVANIIVAIAEILIFSILFNKINNFFVSTVTSIFITLVIHYPLTDYRVLRKEPDALQIMLHNLIVNIGIMLVYTCIISMLLKVNKLKYNKYNPYKKANLYT